MTQLFYFISFSLLGVYIFNLLSFINGWKKIIPFNELSNSPSTLVSVIIPFRDEEANIIQCLNSLLQQKYPNELLEIILVNDASSDHSYLLIESFIKENQLYTIKLISNELGSGKKDALAKGIIEAKGKLIMTTDADCVFHKDWILTTVSYYEKHQPKMIVGPVVFYEEKGIFEKMQSLEFLSLIGIGGASLQNGNPIMCNGANLAYEKEAFLEVNGFKDSQNIPTGDDVFLMFKINEKYPNKVHFLKSLTAIVNTHPQKSVSDFMEQRKRWTSKTSLYKNTYVNYIAYSSYFFNLIILLTAVLSLIYCDYLNLFIILFVSKTLIDFLFLYLVCGFFKRKDLLKYILIEQLLYIIYIVYIGFASIFGKYEWKNREINHNKPN